MSLFSFEIIEVILSCFLCKESKCCSLIFSNHFLWSKSKRKGMNFFLCNAAKVLLLMNFSLSGDNCHLFDLQRAYHLKNFVPVLLASPKHNENL